MSLYTNGAQRVRIDSGGSFTLGDGAYQTVLFDTSPSSVIGNGTMEIQPATAPGSGTANFTTYFKDKAGGGTTKHHVKIDGDLTISGTLSGAGSFVPVSGGTFTGSVVIDNSGSGDSTLTLSTTTGGDPTIIMNSDAANRSGLIKYQDNGTNIGRIEYVHNGDTLKIQAGSATGATLEVTNTLLYVNDEIRVGTSSGAINQTGIIKESGSTYGLGLFTWGDTAPVQIGGGSVLIEKESGGAANLTVSGNITFGTVNPFSQSTNVLDGTGTNGARIRSAVSAAGTPTFSNSDDTDTGMFFPSANSVALSTGGTQAFSIDSSQNTTFAGDITVDGGASSTINIYKDDTGNGKLSFYNDSTQQIFLLHDVAENFYIHAGSGSAMILATNGATTLTLDTSNNATFQLGYQ